MTSEDYERAMDLRLLAHVYDLRHQDVRDDWRDAADEALTDELHEPIARDEA